MIQDRSRIRDRHRHQKRAKNALLGTSQSHAIHDLIFHNQHTPYTIQQILTQSRALPRSKHNCSTGLSSQQGRGGRTWSKNLLFHAQFTQRTFTSILAHSPSTLQSSQSHRNRQSPLKSQRNTSTKRGEIIELDLREATLFSPCPVDLLHRDSRIATKLHTHPLTSFTGKTERPKSAKTTPKKAVSKLLNPLQPEVHSVKQEYPRSIQPHNTMQYHSIPCNAMQYCASLITADGAYYCPVGSIWLFFLSEISSVSLSTTKTTL